MIHYNIIISVVSIGLALSFACDSERERVYGQGVHSLGWQDEEADTFHGKVLRDQGYPLQECQECHGQDYAGGDVDVSCSNEACHSEGVDSCFGACHGDSVGPLPDTGAHLAHASFCDTCHPVPTGLLPPHVNLNIDVEFAGLANRNEYDSSYDAANETCATYCHLGESPAWNSGRTLDCSGCHEKSANHLRFDRVVDESTCAGCHEGSPEVGHLDGQLLISVSACDTCHGTGAQGVPPVSLAGEPSSSSAQVGAHQRHLDSSLPDRIGKVVPCERCHVVPSSVLQEGHLDSTAPASVDVIQGSYNADTGTCQVSCHFDRSPGPSWSDDSGAQRDCDACHAFPPVLTRVGTRHPPSVAETGACLECHSYSEATHVDGQVTF